MREGRGEESNNTLLSNTLVHWKLVTPSTLAPWDTRRWQDAIECDRQQCCNDLCTSTLRYVCNSVHADNHRSSGRLKCINNNLAIANRSRVSCAHNTLRAYICVNITSWPWNQAWVTQGHWKRNNWIDHTRLSSSRVIWRWILLWP